MSEKLTAEEYKEKYKHRTAFGVYALDFVNLLTYKQIVEKEAVEKFSIQLIEKLKADDKPISFLMDIKSIAKQHGVEL